jgi:septal ring factor EnvC (AmiA/AmiB activator)
MTKERLSVTVDPKVADFLQQSDVNASGLVNRLVATHMQRGCSQDTLRRQQIIQLEREIESFQSQIDLKQEGLKELRSTIEKENTARERFLEKARKALRDRDCRLN